MTNEQVYEKLLRLDESLINIRSSLARMETVPSLVKDHEGRIRALEAYYNRARGALAVSAVAGGLISGGIVAAIQIMFG